MSEQTVELEIPLLLPGVAAEDGCLARLETALRAHKGLRRVHLEREKQPVSLCLHYDPDLISLDAVIRTARRAGAGIANRFHHDLVAIEGMDCSDCVTVIEHGVGRMTGVLAVNVNYAAQMMRVEYDTRTVNRGQIEKRLHSLGYRLPAAGWRGWYQANRELVFSLGAGVLVAAGWLGETIFGLPLAAALALYLAAYGLAGWDLAHHAWHALTERRFDTDLLMLLAALGAAALGAFADGAFLLFLFSLGHALEERALDHARQAVRALADLTPKTALVRRAGQEWEVPVDALELDACVLVRPGVRVPVDGVVLAGRSAVNQAPVTGESLPVEKAPGELVFAGTINGEGVLDVRVTKLAKDSTLARVLQLVEAAQTQKSPTQQTVERFERVFVPAVLGLTVLAAGVPPLFGVPFSTAFLRAMTLLVAASPCALALGTPAAILAGVAQAARHGVLVKGGVHLENLGRLQAVAFDKTGTLTQGRPAVSGVIVFAAGWSEAQVLSLAAAVERRSAHPLAQAVVRAAAERGLALPAVEAVTAQTGSGLRASWAGRTVLLGKAGLLDEAEVPRPAAAQAQIDARQADGQTVVLAAVDGVLVGALALADTLRPEAPAALAALRRLGVRATVMLTGDTERAARVLAAQAGLTDFRAGLLPEDKLAAVQALIAQYGRTAMIGDGVNDAPALAQATVGIAIGGAGTDVALETADVALMGDDLARLPFAVGLGRATQAVIRQNLAVALGVMALLMAAALTGWAGMGLAIGLHEGSTIVVVLNALRLLRFQPRA